MYQGRKTNFADRADISRHMLDMSCKRPNATYGFKRWTSSAARGQMWPISDEPLSYLREMTAIDIGKPGATTGCLAKGGSGIDVEYPFTTPTMAI
jgi:hypothetical protein